MIMSTTENLTSSCSSLSEEEPEIITQPEVPTHAELIQDEKDFIAANKVKRPNKKSKTLARAKPLKTLAIAVNKPKLLKCLKDDGMEAPSAELVAFARQCASASLVTSQNIDAKFKDCPIPDLSPDHVWPLVKILPVHTSKRPDSFMDLKVFDKNVPNNDRRYNLSYVKNFAKFATMDQYFQNQISYHYSKNEHHPEHWHGTEMSVSATMEMMNDLCACAARLPECDTTINAVLTACSWCYTVTDGKPITNAKFVNASGRGLLAWFCNVIRQSVSSSAISRDFKMPTTYRTACNADFENEKYLLGLVKGTMANFLGEIKHSRKLRSYVAENKFHRWLVDTLNKSHHLPIGHDTDKSTMVSTIAYCWQWFIKNAPLEKHEPTSDSCDGCGSPDPFRHEQGCSSASSTSNSTGNLIEGAREGISKLLESTILSSQFKDLTLGAVKQAQEAITGAASAITDMIQSFMPLIEELKNKVIPFLNKIPGFASIPDGFSMVTVLQLVVCYLLWINVESVLLKTAVCMYSVSVLSDVFKGLSLERFSLAHWWRKYTGVPEEDSGEHLPTSDDDNMWFTEIFTAITEDNLVFGGTLCAVLVTMLTGVHCALGERNAIGKKFISVFKNLHFVGAGLFGIERCMRYFTAVIKTVMAWFRNRCGVPMEEQKLAEEKQLLANKALRWVAFVDTYRTEEGIRLIRNSKKDFDIAINLFNESIELVRAAYEDKLPRLLASNVLRLENEARRLFNIATRLKRFGLTRFTPFHFQFCGAPGVGKSVLIQNLVNHIHNTYYPDRNRESMVYNRGNNDHWDGYLGQPIIVKDEAYPAKIPEKLIEDLAIVSCNPYLTPQADLVDKGSIYLESDWYLTNTNIPYPACGDVYDMQAIHRRRHMLVEVKCDPKVKDSATSKFDLGLFQKHYPGQNSRDFPHLKFTVMKSVQPTSINGTDRHVAKECYYGEEEALPCGLTRPLADLTWDQLLAIMHSRRTAMRHEEKVAFEGGSRTKNILLNYIEVQNLEYSIKSKKAGASIPRIFDLNSLEISDLEHLSEGPEFKTFSQNDLQELYVDFMRGDRVDPDPLTHIPTSDEERMSIDEIEALVSSDAHLDSASSDEIFGALSYYFDHYVYTKDCSRKEFRRIIKLWSTVSNARYKMTCENIAKQQAEKKPEVEEKLVYKPLTIDEEIARGAALLKKRGHHMGSRLRNDGGPSYFVSDPILPNDTPVSDKKTDLVPERYNTPSSGLVGPFFGMVELPPGHYSIHPNMAKMLESQERQHLLASWKRSIEVPIHHMTLPFYMSGQSIRLTSSMRASQIGQRFSHLGGKLPLTTLFCALLEKVEHDGEMVWCLRMNGSNRLPPFARDGLSEILTELSRSSGYAASTMEKSAILNLPGMFESISFFMDHLNDEEREVIYDYACGYSLVRLQLVTFSARVRDSCKAVISPLKDLVFRTATWFWCKFKQWGKLLATLACAGGVIYLLKAFAAFVSPHEPTSKKFFRTANAKRIIAKYTSSGSKGTGYLDSFDRYRKRCLVSYRLWDHDNPENCQKAHGIRCGRLLITVAHPFSIVNADHYVISLKPTTIGQEPWEASIRRDSVRIGPGNDIAIVYLRDFSPAPDCSRSFWSDKDAAGVDLPNYVELMRNKDVGQTETLSLPVHSYTDFKFRFPNGDKMNAPFIKVNWQSSKGYSGSPVFAHLPQTNGKLVGVQSNVADGHSYISIVTQEMIEAVRSEFYEIVHTGPLVHTYTSATPEMAEMINSHVDIIGKVKDEYVQGYTNRTAYVKTPLAPYFESDSVPALLNGKDPRVPPGTHPCAHSANKSGRDVMHPLDPVVLQRAVDGMAAYYICRLDLEDLKVLDDLELVIRGVPGTEPVNTKTSPGIPYVWMRDPGLPGKKTFVRYSEAGDIEYLANVLAEDFRELEESMSQGIIPPSQMYEFPKDELRPRLKAMGDDSNPQKTRTISVLPMTMNMLYRKYFLSFDAQVHRWADGTFPCCVGINPEGPAFTNAYYNLKSASMSAIAADIGNWDGHWTPQLAFAYLEVVQNCYDNAHFRECDDCHAAVGAVCSKQVASAMTRAAIFDFNLFGNFQFYDAMCQKQRGMSSGFAGTADVNTGSHLLLLYYLYLKALTKYPSYWPFDEFLRLCPSLIYGDDIVLAVSPEIRSLFSEQYYANSMRQLGWPITAADKSPLVRFELLDRCTFLKRSFKVDYELGIVLGALSLDTINDMLHWNKASPEPRSQLYTNIQLALEYLFAHGRDTYREYRDKLIVALKKEHIPIYCPTYSETRAKMLSRYYNEPQQITLHPSLDMIEG